MALAEALLELRDKFGNKAANTEELLSCVKEILPLEYYNVISVKGTNLCFQASAECDLRTDEVANFVENYTAKTNETLRKLTPKIPSKGNVYEKMHYFRCHHKTHYENTMNHIKVARQKPSKRFKNTYFPFSLCVRIKRETPSSKFSAILDIEYNHNHPVQSLQSLSFRDISDDVSNRIKQLFERGFTPGLVYREILL